MDWDDTGQGRRVGSHDAGQDVVRRYADLTGYHHDSPDLADAIHEADRARVVHTWELAQGNGRFCSEYRLRYRDGHFRHVRVEAERSVTPAGRDVWLGTIREVSGDHPHECQGVRCYCKL